MDSTFHKDERLKSNQAIQDLLKKGQSLSSYPLKLYWSTSKGSGQRFPAKIAVSVPKKKFRKAVDRNLMKRRIRESYRKNKHLLYDFLKRSDTRIWMVILYISDEFLPYSRIESGLKDLISKLLMKIEE